MPDGAGASSASGGSGRPRVRTSFLTLTLVGVIATSVGLYTYYQAFSIWPKEIRDDLRTALKAQRKGDFRRAEAAYRSALKTAQLLPEEQLGTNPLLKISGIGIALGSCLEDAGRLKEAYEAYNDTLEWTRSRAKTGNDRLRAVALAQRCGDFAGIKELQVELPGPSRAAQADGVTSLAEEHLRWSVEEMLRLAVPEETRARVLGGGGHEMQSTEAQQQDGVVLADLPLPPWLSTATLGASLESLGQLYAAQGRRTYAVPLYVQAINLLMPPHQTKRKQSPTVADRCRTGILMNNVAQLLVDAKDESRKVDDATAWAMRGLDIVAYVLRGTGWDQKGTQGVRTVESGGADEARSNEVKATCWTAEVALLINLGELSRLRRDDCKAREFFQRAYVRSDTYGMREARARCAQALSELETSGGEKRAS